MKERVRFLSYLLITFSLLLVGLTRTAFTQERQPKASLKRPLQTSERTREKAVQKIAQETLQVSNEREVAARSAMVNFAELARQQALAPVIPQEMRFIPEPEEEGKARERALPSGSKVVWQEAAPSDPQPLGPSPAASLSFQGTQTTGWIPPDTQGAAGPNHLVVAVNGGVLVQSKTGSALGSASLIAFFGNPSNDVFDPRVQYDPYGGRWIIIAAADRQSAASSVMVAVSQTNNPTGNWNIYRIDVDSTNQSWADYPLLGFNKDWIVVSVNMFENPGSGAQFYSRLFVLKKADFYSGVTGHFTQLTAPNNVGGTIVPTSTYDATLSTMYLLQNWNGNFNGSGFLRLYTITGAVGFEALNNISSPIFISTPNPWASFPAQGANFAPQLGTSNKIQINDASIQNVVYRNGSLWCTHTIFLPASTPTRSSVQWWQINTAGASIQQRGRIDSSNGSYFYAFPSIAVNQNNDVLIGYSRFSSVEYAGAGYAYRAGTDAANSMRDDTVLRAGAGPYNRTDDRGSNRWGDYSGTSVDPVNDTDLWTLQEYATTNNNWATWWGRINNSVQTPPNNNFASAQVISGSTGGVGGINIGANKEAGEPNHAGNTGGASVWYRWQAPSSGNTVINTAGSNFDTLLGVYTGSSVGGLTTIASNDDDPVSGGVDSVVNFNAVAGTIYYIAVDGYFGATGNIILNWILGSPPNPLRIDSVTPAAGRTTGGRQIRLVGSFVNLSSVIVGGIVASWSYSNGTSEVMVTTPAHTAGAVSIDLVPTSGSLYSKSNAFAYLPTTFTDDTLLVGVTAARAQHIIEIRQAVDALRAVAGLGPAAWTDPALSPFSTSIKAAHVQELRTYLDDVASRLGYSTSPYTDPSLTTGFVIKRVHIEELRQLVRAIAGQ